MPEGPEIRLAADSVFHAVGGAPLTRVDIEIPGLAPYASTLRGRTVTAVDTHGKAMLTRFSNGLTLYSHNQLYGRWYTSPEGEAPHTNRSLRVALHTDRGSAFLYSATDVEVLDEAALAAHPFLAGLGPDILDPRLDTRAIAARLRDPAWSGRQLASLYLDQGFLAGNGNYLRSEILHFAGVHPALRPKDLSNAERQRLARTTLSIARRAYEKRGITNPPRVVNRLKRRGWTYGRFRFAVFGRTGRSCHSCGSPIEETVIGRKVFFCPTCQARP